MLLKNTFPSTSLLPVLIWGKQSWWDTCRYREKSPGFWNNTTIANTHDQRRACLGIRGVNRDVEVGPPPSSCSQEENSAVQLHHSDSQSTFIRRDSRTLWTLPDSFVEKNFYYWEVFYRGYCLLRSEKSVAWSCTVVFPSKQYIPLHFTWVQAFVEIPSALVTRTLRHF